jgi:hypothetical protein
MISIYIYIYSVHHVYNLGTLNKNHHSFCDTRQGFAYDRPLPYACYRIISGDVLDFLGAN